MCQLFFHRHPRGRYMSGPSDLYFGRAVSLQRLAE
jgi:hypothetical protein